MVLGLICGRCGFAGIRAATQGAFAILVLFAFSTSAPAEELSAERLLDPGRLSEIQIEIPEADWRALCLQTRDFRTAFTDPTEKPFKYFKADVTIDGVKIGSVGIRKKGFLGSLDDHWPSLKIKFDQSANQDPIPGLDTLTLNNNKQDPSLVSQFLAYRLFNAAGVHAPRTGFARVTVNGEYLGIYTNVESIGRPFLERRFGESSGQLYEGTLCDFHPSALTNLEAKFKQQPLDRGTAARLAQLLASKDPLIIEEVEKLVDLDAFLRYWAIEGLLVFWDGYCNNQNNYWVYEQQNGKLFFMPWGADMAFTGGEGFLGFGGVSVYAESMLANRLYRTEGVAERYRQTMLTLLETIWKESELLAAIDQVEALVGSQLHQRQASAPREMNAVRKFIAGRRDSMTKLLKKWPAKVSADPRKPAYTVPVGVVKGSFGTQWADQPPANPLETGAAELRMTLNGEEVVVEKLGVGAHPAPKSPFGDPGRGPGGRPGAERPAQETERTPVPDANPVTPAKTPAALVFTGVRTSDSKKFTLTLTVDRGVFAASAGKTVQVRGTLMVGQEKFSIFNPFAGRTLAGQLRLTDVGVTAGDRIAGEFEVTISETHGGFAGRRGPREAKNAGRPEQSTNPP